MTEAEHLRAALAKLVKQIEMGTYQDNLGHQLKMNVHFIAAKALVSPNPGEQTPDVSSTLRSR